MNKTLLLTLALMFFGVPSLAAETPEEGVQRVERAWMVCTSGELNEPEFIRISKEIAAQHNIAIIAPIMRRSREWKGEEGLIYCGVVLSLPKEKARAALWGYLCSPNENERVYAGEFLVEIQMNGEAEAEAKK